jgi:hypothetical protein
MADVSASTERPTIDRVLQEFLAEQQRRVSPRTFHRYAEVVKLLRACLNGYGYQSLPETDRARWEAAFDAGDEDAFCRLFGPEQIVENYGEFLGYFVIRKVLAGQELLRAAGTVTRRLAQWLAERGYLDPAQADVAAASAAEASRDLPRAEQLAILLHERARGTRLDPTTLAARDYVEDCLEIERVQPGALWFADGIGPVAVPTRASELAEPGWSVTVVLGRSGDRWQLLEVGNVYP